MGKIDVWKTKDGAIEKVIIGDIEILKKLKKEFDDEIEEQLYYKNSKIMNKSQRILDLHDKILLNFQLRYENAKECLSSLGEEIGEVDEEEKGFTRIVEPKSGIQLDRSGGTIKENIKKIGKRGNESKTPFGEYHCIKCDKYYKMTEIKNPQITEINTGKAIVKQGVFECGVCDRKMRKFLKKGEEKFFENG